MAVANAVIDAALAVIEDNCTRVDITTADPGLTYGSIAGVTVGNYTVDGADFTIADGDVSGRKNTLAAQSGNNGTGTGAGNNLAFSNGSDTTYLTIDADGDTVNSGSAVNIGETNIYEIRDPA